MYNFKTLKCSHCGSVVANLPEEEIRKLEGHIFVCDCCNNLNTLIGQEFKKCQISAYVKIFSLIREQILV